MYPFRWAAAVVAVAAWASAGVAQPQPTGLPPAPSFGQYLNLINRGGSPALNYYGIVQPQLQLSQQLNQVNQQQRQLNLNQQQLGQQLNAAEAGIYGQSVFGYNRYLRGTGYIPTFNNTGHYFNTNPALGAGGGYRGGSGYGLAGTGGGTQVGPRTPFAGAVGSGVGGVGGVGGIRR